MRRTFLWAVIGLATLASVELHAEEAAARVQVKVRAEADLSARIVAVLDKGAKVEILEDLGDFVRIRRLGDGAEGFLPAQMLELAAGRSARGQNQTQYRTRSVAGVEIVPLAPVVLWFVDEDTHATLADEGVAQGLADETTTPGVETLAQAGVEARQPEPVVSEAVEDQVAVAPSVSVSSRTDQPARFFPVAISGRLSLSLGVGLAQGDVSASDLTRALDPHASFVAVRDLDDSGASWEARIGYALSPRWSIAASFLDLGEYNSAVDIRNADLDAVQRVLADKHPVSGTGFGLRGVGSLQRGPWDLSSSVGFFHALESDIKVLVDGQPVTVSGNDFSPMLGLAASYRWTRRWALGVTASYMKLNQQILQSQMQLQYFF